eukprot:TRINITY_DN1942_c0_g2_i2.p1 TRINITY_DN1942_c0_g2~~TRINITY_DN1942_c0_g2_i2.p1  ORF type:complete len:265 (-),score=47.12 TRINITY_DN1942_c0_g2_i2:42-836(-)
MALTDEEQEELLSTTANPRPTRTTLGVASVAVIALVCSVVAYFKPSGAQDKTFTMDVVIANGDSGTLLPDGDCTDGTESTESEVEARRLGTMVENTSSFKGCCFGFSKDVYIELLGKAPGECKNYTDYADATGRMAEADYIGWTSGSCFKTKLDSACFLQKHPCCAVSSRFWDAVNCSKVKRSMQETGASQSFGASVSTGASAGAIGVGASTSGSGTVKDTGHFVLNNDAESNDADIVRINGVYNNSIETEDEPVVWVDGFTGA